MLISHTPISALDEAARQRLARASSHLLQTNEASLGYVMFEGRHFSVQAVRELVGSTRQFLREAP